MVSNDELFPRLNQLREGRCLEHANCHLISEVKEASLELNKFDLQFLENKPSNLHFPTIFEYWIDADNFEFVDLRVLIPCDGRLITQYSQFH